MNTTTQPTPAPLSHDSLRALRARASGAVLHRMRDVVSQITALPGQPSSFREGDLQRAYLVGRQDAIDSAFGQAGRTLGVDAAKLGESIDLAALIQAFQRLETAIEHVTVSGGEYATLAAAQGEARAQLAKLPKAR